MKHCSHPGPCCVCEQQHPAPRRGAAYCAGEAVRAQALTVLACVLGLLAIAVYAAARAG